MSSLSAEEDVSKVDSSGPIKTKLGRKEKAVHIFDKSDNCNPFALEDNGIKNVAVIHNGIDLNIFRPVESSWKNDQKITKPMILTCSAVWNERKGYSDVMKLAKMVPEYQVVIIGITAQQKKTLPSNLFGVLRTNSVEEMVEIYSAADVFINPTYEDNFPTVNLEALACGTPVITYNTGGSPEAITTDCGLIINKGNILEIAEGIRRKIYTKSIINEFCLDRSRSFSSEEKFKLYYKLFEKIGMV